MKNYGTFVKLCYNLPIQVNIRFTSSAIHINRNYMIHFVNQNWDFTIQT